MSEFFSFLKVFVTCGTVFFVVMLVLMSLPKSALRSVGMEMGKWVMAGCLLIMVPSPVDVVPDAIVVAGWADDIAYVVGAVAAAKSALAERKQRAMMEASANDGDAV